MSAGQHVDGERDDAAGSSPTTPLLDFRHHTPSLRVHCSTGAVATLADELQREGCSRAVIVCGRSVRHHADAFARVVGALGDRLVDVFDEVAPHSPVPVVEAARDVLARSDADAVVAVGGGSAIVTARAASILLAEGRDVRELCTRREPDGRMHSPRLRAEKLPQWVVATTPTTAYAKAGSAVRDPRSGERLALFDPKTRARTVIFDPALALTAPASLAEGSALNAFAMAVEGLQSNFDDPLAEALLAHALRLLTEALSALRDAPGDAAPRLRMMVGALLSGQGTDYAGGGLAQALAHALGPLSTASNGVVEALLLPHSIRFNAPVTGPGCARLAAALAAAAGDASSSAERAVAGVEELLDRCGVPRRLRDVGVREDQLEGAVEHALEDWWLSRSPRRVGEDDLRTLIRAAW